MKTATAFTIGMFFGATVMLFWLAMPIATAPSEAVDIRAFREMGCEPWLDEHKALHSGCEKIKHVELKNADEN